MAKKGDEVTEGVTAVQLGAVDQAHEGVAYPSTVHRPVEETVLPVEDHRLEGRLDDVVVQGGARLAEKQRQLLPVLLQ